MAAVVHSAPLDLIADAPVSTTWLEIGFTEVDDSSWTNINTTASDFVNPIVFLSLPPVEGETFNDGYPSSLRLNNIVVSNGFVNFDAKVYLPNDGNCSTQWYTFSPIAPKFQISWMVVEKGAYHLLGSTYIISSGSVYRKSATINDQFVWIPFTPGCNASSPTSSCAFSANVSTTDIGAITQIQTLNNDLFLMSRAQIIQRRRIKVALSPHDSVDLSYYVLPYNETVGAFAFVTGKTVKCVEGLSWETKRFLGVTSLKLEYVYYNTYNFPPGVYGSLVTYESLVDSTGIRAFDKTSTSVYIITQEDKCYDEQVEHTTEEDVGLFIVGSVQGGEGIICNVKYTEPDAPICSSILLFDLFGDGWGENVTMTITTDSPTGFLGKTGSTWNPIGDVLNYTLGCQCDEITVCSTTGGFFVKVGAYAEPVRHPWEVYWTYEDRYNISWVGTIGSYMEIQDNIVVDYYGLLDTNSTADPETECLHCRHKPKPPSKPTTPAEPISAPEPGSKPKPKPGIVGITLFDLDKDSWYDDSGIYVAPCEDSDIEMPYELIYPRYFITNIDRTEIVANGSMCLHEHFEVCEEILPPKGKFVFRVAGYELVEGDATWKFCGEEGGINDELQFEIHDGKCHAISNVLNAEDMCDGILTNVIYLGVLKLDLTVNSGVVTEFDTMALEHIIYNSVALQSSHVVILSTTFNDKNQLLVSFKLTAVVEETGISGTLSQNVDTFTSTIQTKFSSASTEGYFLALLTQELSANLNNAQDILQTVTSATISEMKLQSVEYKAAASQSSEQNSNMEDAVKVEEPVVTKFNAGVVGLYAFIAMVAVGALFVVVIKKVGVNKPKYPHTPLPDSSLHTDDLELTASGQTF